MTLRQAAIAVLSPFTLPLALPLWIAGPLLKLRLGRITPERIGHLAVNTDLLLRRRLLGKIPKDCRLILFASGPVSNRSLLKLYQRQVPIFVNGILSRLYTLCEPWLKHTPFHVELPLHSGKDEYELWDAFPAVISFAPEEEARGQEGLRRMGIGPKDWFVCFFNRDSSYLKPRERWKGQYSYHDFRDTSVGNFLPAARWIAEQGGFSLRMGAEVSEALPSAGAHSRVIDYATRLRDEFMDVYLLAKCRFLIASDSGMCQVATVFGTPVLNTNAICLDWASFRRHDLFLQKKYVDAKTGRTLSWREVLDRGLARVLDGNIFPELGLARVENTPDEILEATREMLERLEGRWKPRPGDEELQQEYRRLFKPEHYCHGFRSRVGADFLRRNKDELLPEPRGAAAVK